MQEVKTNSYQVKCHGYHIVGDHPTVYLTIDPELGFVNCNYCNKRFSISS